MKPNTSSFKSYHILRCYGDTDTYYEDIPKSLEHIIHSLDFNGKSYSKCDIFRGWNPTAFTGEEIEYIKSTGVLEKYKYEVQENELDLGFCLLDITDNTIYCVYRFGVMDLGGNELVIARKYLGKEGVQMYSGFSSELYSIPANRLKFVSDRDLINMGYDFKTNLYDSFICH